MEQKEKFKEQEEKVRELFKNPCFVEEMEQASGYEEISSLLKTHDIEISAEDLKKSHEIFKNNSVDGELNEGILEEISGGFPPVIVVGAIIGLAVWTAYSAYKGAQDGYKTCMKKKKRR